MSSVKPKRLGDLITLKRGYDLPEKDRIKGSFPVVSSSGISGYHNEYKVEGEGVVTGRYGTLGKMYFMDGKYWPHNTALYVQDFKRNDPKYIYYLLSCIGRIRTSDKSAVPGVNRNEMHEMAVPAIEDKKSQIAVRELLWSLDEKIELNNKINAELEAMAKLIYDYWFVQFDFPDANGKPYKSSGGKMVYNEELKREIPEGWGVNELSEIATIKAGGDKPKVFSSELNSQCAVPIYSNGIKNYGIYGYTEKAKIQEPSITISARGTIGVTFLRMHPFVPIIRLIVVTPCKHVYLKYLDEFLKAIEFENSGSVQMQLTAPQVAQQKVICPSEEVLVKFSSITSDAIDKIELIKNESSELIKLRDWLLPMLMNGQVTVR
jgi:type I restriction enzyme S subunit